MNIYDILFIAKTGKIKPFSNPFDAAFGKKIWVERDNKSYGYHIDSSVSSPINAVTYIAKNASWSYLGLRSNSSFSWGSWEDSWLIKGIKPCILSSSGEVLLYLNPNDYTKDVHGNTAPITQEALDNHTDERFHGANVMIEFPKIWTKVVGDETVGSYSVYFSQIKVDKDYKDYAYISPSGEHKEHFYKGAYVGSLYDGKMRSVSDAQVKTMINASDVRRYCEANGSGWHMDTYSETILIAQILTLLGRALNTQSRMGYGAASDGTERAITDFRTGVCNSTGLFYGSNANYDHTKILGIEDYYGVCNRWLDGFRLDDDYNVCIKMCYGTEDGSTSNNYSDAGSGYVNTNTKINFIGSVSQGRSSTIQQMFPHSNGALIPIGRRANSQYNAYYADGLYAYHPAYPAPEGSAFFATRGGSWTLKQGAGAYELAFDTEITDDTQWKIGTSISYV